MRRILPTWFDHLSIVEESLHSFITCLWNLQKLPLVENINETPVTVIVDIPVHACTYNVSIKTFFRMFKGCKKQSAYVSLSNALVFLNLSCASTLYFNFYQFIYLSRFYRAVKRS